jgi:hypothetical protein
MGSFIVKRPFTCSSATRKNYRAMLNARLLDASGYRAFIFAPAFAGRRPSALDDAEQPQDEDQEQDSAKTYIHVVLRILFCSYNKRRERPVPIVTEPFVTLDGYDFTSGESRGFA